MIEGGWTLRAVAGHRLRGLQARAVSVGRANGNHVGIVTRRANRGISVCAGTVILAHITSGDDHHDSCSPSGLHGLAERIERVAFINTASQRQIDDADVVSALETEGLLNGRDYRTVRADSVRIECTQIDDRGFWRDTAIDARII